MSAPRKPSGESNLARYLGLKVPVLNALRDGIAAGEFPIYLRCAQPSLAGQFPHAFGFELLLERLRQAESIERRRANLLRSFEGREEEFGEAIALVQSTMSEGELEDAGLALHPSHAPANFTAPEKEEHIAFLDTLRGDASLARELHAAFDKEGTITVSGVENPSEDQKRFDGLTQEAQLIAGIDPGGYLLLRRAERAHAVKVAFELPRPAVTVLFDKLSSYPAQEKESYRSLFMEFITRERIPRLVQQLRASLKRRAEDLALQSGWEQVERSLDRGRQEGLVLGLCASRKGKIVIAASRGTAETPRTIEVEVKSETLAEDLKRFLGEEEVSLAAMQADSATRNSGQKVIKALPNKPRVSMVPLAVVKTMLREVARRSSEALLSHDERQAFLVATLASDPRAAAFHTPHIVRAFIPYRGEINHRILDDFEVTFLRSLLAQRGVDINTAAGDLLRLVPGLDAEAVLVERSTAPFRSLVDLFERIAITPQDWRAACCILRVRGGDEPLDSRPLHPMFYAPLYAAMAASEAKLGELLKEPGKVNQLDWSTALEGENHIDGIVARVREGLSKPRRSRMRFQGAPGGKGKGNFKGGGSRGGRPLESLRIGETLKGLVKNLADYGAFIDVGAEREGMAHVSQCSDRFIKHPSEVLEPGQELEVRVVSVDLSNRKIRLSLLTEEQEKEREAQRKERAANRGGGGGGDNRGGPGGGRGGDRGRGGPGGRGKRRDNFGPDPKAKKKEEFDPTNPFYVFFQEQQKEGKK
jgi:uncharacterized protein